MAVNVRRYTAFSFETRETRANNTFANFILGLNGSRDAIEEVESAATTALGSPLVSCYAISAGSLALPFVEKDMAKQQARLKEVNRYTLEDPIGTVVLSYMWGAIPTELNVTKWNEYWMTIETLTTFFGWMVVINVAYLAIATLAMIGMQTFMINVHRRLFGIEEKDLKLAYFNWVANYKIVAVVFAIVPYVALKLM